jgi:hypothetical protein
MADVTVDSDATLEDWVRGYLLTYLPDTEATGRLVEKLVARVPDWAAGQPLTETQRETLEDDFGGNSASLLQIIREVMDGEGVDYTEQQATQIARMWLRREAPTELKKVVEIDTELPPVYAEEIRRAARKGVRSQL